MNLPLEHLFHRDKPFLDHFAPQGYPEKKKSLNNGIT